MMRYANDRPSAILDSISTGVAYCRAIRERDAVTDFVILEVNSAFKRLIAFEGVENRTVAALFPGIRERNPELFDALGRIWSSGRSEHVESYFAPRDHWLRFTVSPAGGDHFVVEAEDVTERKRAAVALLHESEEKYRTLFDNAADGILLMSADGSSFTSNKAFASMHGYTQEEIRRMKLSDLDTPETARLAPERLRQLLDRKTLTFEVEHFHKDGHTFPLAVTCSVIQVDGQPFFQGFHQDLSERKRAEEALKNAQRLESIGVLAGGVAHDFNNLLMGISGNVELISERVTDARTLESLRNIEGSIARAKALSAQLLTFAKGGKPVRNVGRIQPCLRSTAEFALSGSNVSCRFSLPDDLWPCRFDRNQVGQVVENIVINAKQAMPDGGTIAISAANVSLGAGDVPMLSAGDYLKISIKDRGVGIPREILDRIFDPYFTTKQTGSGLGLAISFSIIKKHDGHVVVESEPGEGSVFHVFLPAWHDAVEATVESPPRIARGAGRVLVMDDVEMILDVVGQGLEGAGYAVTKTRDGREALDRFRQGLEEGRPYSAVILDLTIPGGMGGKDAASEIRKLDAAIPILAASGYSSDPVIACPEEFGFTAGIAKPFVLSELIDLLQKQLRGPARE